MTAKRRHFAEAIALVVLCASPAFAADLETFSGSIAGFVRDNAGLPQMGATVSLMNRYERVIRRGITNDRGIFGFGELPPDVYSIRVSVPSFVPAIRHRIAVQPGMQSLLYVNLASVLSSIELVYAAPGQGALMSDDWRWTLKESSATRPILRALPDLTGTVAKKEKKEPKQVFSDTRGLVSLSGGDGGSLTTEAMQSDLGTAFALETSVLGHNQVQLSGNVGYSARSGLPVAGFRTTYHREGDGPEVTVTVRQLYLPTRQGQLVPGSQDGVPALRSISVATIDQMQITDRLRLEYGGSMDTVSFLDQLNYFSPFARLMYELGKLGEVQLAFSSGAPPVELLSREGRDEAGLQDNLALLSIMPEVSLRNGQMEMQRTRTFEMGYQKRLGSRKLSLSGFRDEMSNTALLLSNAPLAFGSGDLLPDIGSAADVFNSGRFHRHGYSAAMSQSIGDKVEITGSVGRAGALTASGLGDSAEDLRQGLHMDQRYWASARASATLPGTGTLIVTSYQWTDGNALMPAHFYITQTAWPQAGLNIELRQPIPSFLGMPGRLEATAGLQNILAQGYLTVPGASNQQVVLTQSPRAVRGGLAFTF